MSPAELPLNQGGTDGGGAGLIAGETTATWLAPELAAGSMRAGSLVGWPIIKAAAATLAAITPPPDQRSQ
jgi:hypothetical protein